MLPAGVDEDFGNTLDATPVASIENIRYDSRTGQIIVKTPSDERQVSAAGGTNNTNLVAPASSSSKMAEDIGFFSSYHDRDPAGGSRSDDHLVPDIAAAQARQAPTSTKPKEPLVRSNGMFITQTCLSRKLCGQVASAMGSVAYATDLYNNFNYEDMLATTDAAAQDKENNTSSAQHTTIDSLASIAVAAAAKAKTSEKNGKNDTAATTSKVSIFDSTKALAPNVATSKAAAPAKARQQNYLQKLTYAKEKSSSSCEVDNSAEQTTKASVAGTCGGAVSSSRPVTKASPQPVSKAAASISHRILSGSNTNSKSGSCLFNELGKNSGASTSVQTMAKSKSAMATSRCMPGAGQPHVRFDDLRLKSSGYGGAAGASAVRSLQAAASTSTPSGAFGYQNSQNSTTTANGGITGVPNVRAAGGVGASNVNMHPGTSWGRTATAGATNLFTNHRNKDCPSASARSAAAAPSEQYLIATKQQRATSSSAGQHQPSKLLVPLAAATAAPSPVPRLQPGQNPVDTLKQQSAVPPAQQQPLFTSQLCTTAGAQHITTKLVVPHRAADCIRKVQPPVQSARGGGSTTAKTRTTFAGREADQYFHFSITAPNCNLSCDSLEQTYLPVWLDWLTKHAKKGPAAASRGGGPLILVCEELNLENNQIGDQGVQALCRWLGIGHGVKQRAKLIRCGKLSLNNNLIGDFGANLVGIYLREQAAISATASMKTSSISSGLTIKNPSGGASTTASQLCRGNNSSNFSSFSLSPLPLVREVNLSNNFITPDGCAAIFECLADSAAAYQNLPKNMPPLVLRLEQNFIGRTEEEAVTFVRDMEAFFCLPRVNRNWDAMLDNNEMDGSVDDGRRGGEERSGSGSASSGFLPAADEGRDEMMKSATSNTDAAKGHLQLLAEKRLKELADEERSARAVDKEKEDPQSTALALDKNNLQREGTRTTQRSSNKSSSASVEGRENVDGEHVDEAKDALDLELERTIAENASAVSFFEDMVEIDEEDEQNQFDASRPGFSAEKGHEPAESPTEERKTTIMGVPGNDVSRSRGARGPGQLKKFERDLHITQDSSSRALDVCENAGEFFLNEVEDGDGEDDEQDCSSLRPESCGLEEDEEQEQTITKSTGEQQDLRVHPRLFRVFPDDEERKHALFESRYSNDLGERAANSATLAHLVAFQNQKLAHEVHCASAAGSAKWQAPRPLPPYSARDRILLVGEANFTFAGALCRFLGKRNCSGITATGYTDSFTDYEKLGDQGCVLGAKDRKRQRTEEKKTRKNKLKQAKKAKISPQTRAEPAPPPQQSPAVAMLFSNLVGATRPSSAKNGTATSAGQRPGAASSSTRSDLFWKDRTFGQAAGEEDVDDDSGSSSDGEQNFEDSLTLRMSAKICADIVEKYGGYVVKDRAIDATMLHSLDLVKQSEVEVALSKRMNLNTTRASFSSRSATMKALEKNITSFTYVIWNFPHTGVKQGAYFDEVTGRRLAKFDWYQKDKSIQSNQAALFDVFASMTKCCTMTNKQPALPSSSSKNVPISDLITSQTRVHITLKTTELYKQWRLEDLAATQGWYLKRQLPFAYHMFQEFGYQHEATRFSAKNLQVPHLDEAVTFEFGFRPHIHFRWRQTPEGREGWGLM
ncbi:unnamed protein product [Amoebophrya sp. A120]|nr:unnamed protein product [Amoebophrya sp. A120]|eukprot:GSA120T00014985001.1